MILPILKINYHSDASSKSSKAHASVNVNIDVKVTNNMADFDPVENY